MRVIFILLVVGLVGLLLFLYQQYSTPSLPKYNQVSTSQSEFKDLNKGFEITKGAKNKYKYERNPQSNQKGSKTDSKNEKSLQDKKCRKN
jgi:hypothetical protein